MANNEAKAEEKEEQQSFEELGLDPRLIRALTKKGISKPTPIQRKVVPLILEGKDVIAQEKTGSGKTFAYLLPLLQKLFSECGSTGKKSGPSAFVLVPTRELVPQVHKEVSLLIEACRVQLKAVALKSDMGLVDLGAALAGPPDIVVSTPSCIVKCISSDVVHTKAVMNSLSILVLDEADLLISRGYEDDLKILIPHVPRGCQSVLLSATASADIEKLKNLWLHSQFIPILPEVGNIKDEIVPKNVQQSWIMCSYRDKHIYILALLSHKLVLKKVLLFVNTIDAGFRLKLFLEQFGIRSAVLNAELPENSRLHILEEFNAGLFDHLIAIDDCKIREKEQTNQVVSKKSKKHLRQKLDSEFGVVRGIDFKNVYTVINYEMPPNSAGYIHRIGRTGRAFNTGASVSLVSPDEEEIFEEIKTALGDQGITPFPLKKDAVESLRYRAEDVARSITKIAVREARHQDVRNEILNCEKLKSHFEDNPKDLDLLKHDKMLSKKPPPNHLRIVPEYLMDPTIEEASKMVKLARAAMGVTHSARRPRPTKGKFRGGKDPLRTFSAEASKKSSKGGMKRKGNGEGDDSHRHKKKKTKEAN
ncbi:hypothetical protein GIB67_031072 [Kingdonia uniflora]|uniref:RNA helicase n=1 Tax=Kingdonia uniflora TaxID=39325 RepID=A0A7J7LCC0_9MAGN|nr:hypothetical protein GIB67_031072 [Kingdonia uniflora]